MINKKYTFIFITLALCSAIVLSCTQYQPPKNVATDSPTHGIINISVDESFEPVIDAAIKVYEGSFPHTKIIAHYKPEAECFKDFYTDTANRMIIVTRELTHNENKFFTDSIGFSPLSNRIAWDAITLVVNKNDTDSLYTLQSLRQLLQGKLGNTKKVIFDGLNATSTVRFAIDSILHGSNFDTGVVKAVKSSNEVLDYIANTTNSIGLVGISWIGNPEDTAQVNRLKKLKMAYVQCNMCDSTPFVKPTQQSILSKRYSLVRGLYYIVKENYSGLGLGFAEFLRYERGQLIFKRAYLGTVMNFSVRQVSTKSNF